MAGRARPDAGGASALHVFVDIADPRARRVLRDALARDPQIRFVSTMALADVVVGDQAHERRATAMRASAPEPVDAEGGHGLTDREGDVLQALAEGLSNAAIAERLGISRSTVKFHLHAVFSKLDVRSRAEAVAAGIRRGDVLL
jgi:DNA-binding NarL/FixJ family response regulator